jgi:hypothetical protein
MHMDIFAAADSAIDLLAQCGLTSRHEFGGRNGSKWDEVKLTADLIGNHACFCLLWWYRVLACQYVVPSWYPQIGPRSSIA